MSDSRPHAILATQAKYNRSTADSWETYASHRAEVAALLSPLGDARGGRLCVLGAGNCNDLHLRDLTEAYDEVHLVDIDTAALENAARRQGVSDSPRISLHGGVDLTGVADALSGWKRRKPSGAEVREVVRSTATAPVPPPIAGLSFDVVLSPCVLSQIVGFAGDTLGRSHPRYRELLLAIRDRHLRLLPELTCPGGTALLVCDMVSSDSFAELAGVRREKLAALVERLVYRGDFFPSLAPSAVETFFRSDPLIAPLLNDVKRLHPWVWQLTPVRRFLVCAFRLRRKGGTVIL